MKSLKCIAAIIALLFIAMPSFAQNEDPASWKYEVKKKSATEYDLVYHLTLSSGWHIWSLHPGGDGYEIAPSFKLDKKVKAIGAIKESGKMVTTTMDGIEGKINYYADKVDYVQTVTVTGPAKIKCTHTYQVCNDRMCLPPKDKEFVFDIK